MIESQAREWPGLAGDIDSVEQLMRILILPHLPFLVSLSIMQAQATGRFPAW
jgi:hypothetical protein